MQNWLRLWWPMMGFAFSKTTRTFLCKTLYSGLDPMLVLLGEGMLKLLGMAAFNPLISMGLLGIV